MEISNLSHMKSKLIIGLLFVSCSLAAGEFSKSTKPLSDASINKMVNAIGKAENSKKYPYGIVSVSIKGKTQAEREAYARKICYNTVRNNWTRFNNQSKYTDFVEFLGSRYCPVGAENDPKGLNKNWVKNVKFFLTSN